MKAIQRGRKYDVMFIRSDTTDEEIKKFVGCNIEVKTRILSIGFCGERERYIRSDFACYNIDPGKVILKSSQNDVFVIPSTIFDVLFYIKY